MFNPLSLLSFDCITFKISLIDMKLSTCRLKGPEVHSELLSGDKLLRTIHAEATHASMDGTYACSIKVLMSNEAPLRL